MMEPSLRCLPLLFLVPAAAIVAGCANLPTDGSVTSPGQSAWQEGSTPLVRSDSAAGQAAGAWRHHRLPGKTATRFGYVRDEDRDAVAATAEASASLLRRDLRIGPGELALARFSWRVPDLIAGADMALREADDSPVRLILSFEGDRARFSPRDAVLSELAQTLTGEPLPYATLMYVWCNTRPVGTVIASPRTDRIRKLVVESGPGRLNRWIDYERDIQADFERAFGEKAGALTGVAIMTDTDNTRGRARAWYGPVRLLAPEARVPATGFR